MSYFKILVGKDKFTLYDVTKDKHYIVEPEDLDHILDTDNPYNDDGTLNLRSYSDVINYYNRKNSKSKTTKGYISKKANIKKEYQAVSSSNRKDLLRRKLLAQNIDKSVIDKIVKYPTKDVANDLRVDDNTKRILTDIIEDVDVVAPLDDTEKSSINSKYVDETKLEDKRNTLQDRNNLVLNAYNALQANQRTMLNSLRTIRDTIPAVADFPDYGNQLRNLIASFDALNNRVNNLPLPNIPDYAPQLLELNRRVQTLTDAVNNAPAAIDYRPQFTELNNRIREITNAIPAQIDYSRPLLELNNKMNALTDIVQNRPLPVEYKKEFKDLNDRLIELNNNVTANPNRDYTNDIKLLTDTIKENMKLITDGVDNLKNRPQIDYSADLKQIKDNTTSLINSIRGLVPPPVRQEIKETTTLDDVMPNEHTEDNIENRRYEKYEQKHVNRNDNIERTMREVKPELTEEWSKQYLESPIEVLRHTSHRSWNTGPAHSLLKLLNNLNDLNNPPDVKIEKFPDKETNTETYYLTTLGGNKEYPNDGFEFRFNFGQNAPFKRIIPNILDKYDKTSVNASKLLKEFVETITREAKPSDIEKTSTANAYMKVINNQGSPETMTSEQLEFVSKLPSATTTITFDGTINQIKKDINNILVENYEWKDKPKSTNIYQDHDDLFENEEIQSGDEDDDILAFDFVPKNDKNSKTNVNTYEPTNKSVYYALEQNKDKNVNYSSMDESEGLAKILGHTINSKFYNIPKKSGNKFDLSAILSNSINNTY